MSYVRSLSDEKLEGEVELTKFKFNVNVIFFGNDIALFEQWKNRIDNDPTIFSVHF